VGSKSDDESAQARAAAPPAQPAQTTQITQTAQTVPPLCWPFPPGSQNRTEKSVKLKPYTPPKRRSLNQF
jgi:hypothetical protein